MKNQMINLIVMFVVFIGSSSFLQANPFQDEQVVNVSKADLCPQDQVKQTTTLSAQQETEKPKQVEGERGDFVITIMGVTFYGLSAVFLVAFFMLP
ncbi:MAG: hypothetical protein HQM10_12945 [Candidatus Riflebacteria bacterium]|nr:hypothetical protein [Candidatus Riflebacteria bacterium]